MAGEEIESSRPVPKEDRGGLMMTPVSSRVVVAAVALVNAHSWGLNSSYAIFLAYYLHSGYIPGATALDFAFVGGLSISVGRRASSVFDPASSTLPSPTPAPQTDDGPRPRRRQGCWSPPSSPYALASSGRTRPCA